MHEQKALSNQLKGLLDLMHNLQQMLQGNYRKCCGQFYFAAPVDVWKPGGSKLPAVNGTWKLKKIRFDCYILFEYENWTRKTFRLNMDNITFSESETDKPLKTSLDKNQ